VSPPPRLPKRQNPVKGFTRRKEGKGKKLKSSIVRLSNGQTSVKRQVILQSRDSSMQNRRNDEGKDLVAG